MPVWRQGVRHGIPIFLGYFAVSFAFGISASRIGISFGSATLLSFMNLTSAGQLAALDVIARAGSYLSMAALQFVVNVRYFLMSASLSQRVSPDLPLRHRILMAYGITDEVFALSAVFCTLVCGAAHVVGADLSTPLAWGQALGKTISCGVFGLALLLLYWKTRNIWACGVVHGVY